MDAGIKKPPFAWQPLTPRGVAAFAYASSLRLRLVQLLIALIVVAAVLWFLAGGWYPVVQQAVTQMPASGGITNGVLVWDAPAPVNLAENRFLSISVDPDHEGLARGPSHIQIELGRKHVRMISLLGFLEQPYDVRWQIGLNRPSAEPWWGAWSPIILTLVALLVLPVLFLCWTVLATLYAPIAWLVGFFANRELGWLPSWRLCSAALMPGALLMALWIFLYGMGAWDLVQLGLATAIHMIVGWIYVLWCPFLVPKLPPASGVAAKNPFKASGEKK